MSGFTSPALGVKFVLENHELQLRAPDGRVFRTREERVEEIQTELLRTAAAFEDEHTRAITAEREVEQERLRAEEEHERAEQESARAEQERERADQQRDRADRESERAERERAAKDLLLARLRQLGIDPDDVLKPAG